MSTASPPRPDYRRLLDGAEISAGFGPIVLAAGLGLLPFGSATALGGESGLPPSGRAESADVLVAQARRTSGSSIVTLQPPRQDDYWFIATVGQRRHRDHRLRSRRSDAQASRGASRRTDASDLALARGEPAGFAAAIEFGLAVLARMSEGRFELREGAITLEGRTTTGADYAAIEAMAPPQGLDLAMGGVRPPLADPFVWTAEKDEEGGVRFSGFVPGEPARAGLTEAASSVTGDATAVADGAPDGFETSAIAGLAVLATLPSGTVRYDGETWHIEATAETALQAGEARTAFDDCGSRCRRLGLCGEAPPAPPVEALPVIADYAWSAEKLPAGTIALTGYVPTEGLRRVLAIRAGDAAVNEQALGSGAPEGFPLDTLAAIDALKLLDEGTVAFADGKWSLTGRSEDPGAPDAVTAALGERAGVVASRGHRAAAAASDSPTPSSGPRPRRPMAASLSLATSAPPELKRLPRPVPTTVASDTTEIASGAPEGFMPDVIAALDALAQLESGEVTFDGTSWSLTGAPATVAKRDASLAALGAAATPADQWSVALQEPPAPPEPVAEVAAVTEPETPETPRHSRRRNPLRCPPSILRPQRSPRSLPRRRGRAAPAEPEVAAAPPAEPPVEVPAGSSRRDGAARRNYRGGRNPRGAGASAAGGTPRCARATRTRTRRNAVAAVAPEAVATPEPVAPKPIPATVVTIPARVVFDATRADGGPVALTGEVPADAARRLLRRHRRQGPDRGHDRRGQSPRGLHSQCRRRPPDPVDALRRPPRLRRHALVPDRHRQHRSRSRRRGRAGADHAARERQLGHRHRRHAAAEALPAAWSRALRPTTRSSSSRAARG